MLALLFPTLLLATMFINDSNKTGKGQFPNFPKAEYKICSLEELEKIPIENTTKDQKTIEMEKDK